MLGPIDTDPETTIGIQLRRITPGWWLAWPEFVGQDLENWHWPWLSGSCRLQAGRLQLARVQVARLQISRLQGCREQVAGLQAARWRVQVADCKGPRVGDIWKRQNRHGHGVLALQVQQPTPRRATVL